MLKTTAIERVMAKVDRDDPNGCWLWTGALNKTGYGRMSVNGVLTLAHRVSFDLFNGPIPVGMCVLHRCDVPRCVNPAHLFLGTQLDNIADAVSKGRTNHVEMGRATRGEGHGMSKLDTKTVLSIRARVAMGESCRRVAMDIGMHPSTVESVIRRRTWAHVVDLPMMEGAGGKTNTN